MTEKNITEIIYNDRYTNKPSVKAALLNAVIWLTVPLGIYITVVAVINNPDYGVHRAIFNSIGMFLGWSLGSYIAQVQRELKRRAAEDIQNAGDNR